MTKRSGRLVGGRLASLRLTTLALATLVGLSGGILGPLRGEAYANPLPVSDAAGVVRQVACEFRLGFKDLRDRIPGIVGECLDNERTDANGDTIQRTTTGQLTWRKADNATAFTDGHRTWLIGPNGLQDRLNSERFAWEQAAPGTTAVSGGTRGAPNGRSAARQPGSGAGGAPTAYVFETLDEPPALANGVWPCLRENPSCTREPWWAQWNTLQDPKRTQYTFLGPGFVTEYRFAEAVGLLWQWPEGKDLLRAASDHGVRVYVAPDIPRQAFAGYSTRARAIGFNQQFTETSTWMVASVLAHELKHAMDDWAGERQGDGFDDCVAREQEAYKVEARFTRWLYEQQGEFPSPRDVQQTLSIDDQRLYVNLYRIASSDSPESLALEDYRGICSPRR